MLDLSFNKIKEIEGLQHNLQLKKLFLSSNKIHKIKNLKHLKNLQLLELGDNKLRVSCSMNNNNISTLPFLSGN